MHHTLRALAAGALLSLLAACGSGGTGDAGDTSSGGDVEPKLTPTQAAALSSGPGRDSGTCNTPYGNLPMPVAGLTSGLGTGAAGEIAALFNQCAIYGGEGLSWTDANGDPRGACLFVPPNASSASRLPLVVFLQGSVFPATPQLLLSNWVPLTRTADLNGDPARPGFVLLVPFGRNTRHHYPYPDDYGLGWDNWYRNLDRGSPRLNVDVATIDEFIRQTRARGVVDANRLYMTGWSNGAAMAQLYALNTPEVAAAAVYSSPDPFRDIRDPCEQTPFSTTRTPLMMVQNACDLLGLCQSGTAFHDALAAQFPDLALNTVILDASRNPVAACNAACAGDTVPTANPVGLVNHLVWPQGQNAAMFQWLRDHPLSSKRR